MLLVLFVEDFRDSGIFGIVQAKCIKGYNIGVVFSHQFFSLTQSLNQKPDCLIFSRKKALNILGKDYTMKKILFISLGLFMFLHIGINSQNARNPDFDVLMENLKPALDFTKFDILNALHDEKFTCAEIREILESFQLAEYRLDAFAILVSRIKDPQNKSEIMKAFRKDLDFVKTDAYKILARVKTVEVATSKPEPKPVPEKKIEKLTGFVEISPTEDACQPGEFYLSDEVKFHFSANKEVESTSLELWISECKNESDKSCNTPFTKIKSDILPDWNGWGFEKPIRLETLLTDFGKVKLPKRKEWYHFAIIIHNRVVAEKTIKVNNTDCPR